MCVAVAAGAQLRPPSTLWRAVAAGAGAGAAVAVAAVGDALVVAHRPSALKRHWWW